MQRVIPIAILALCGAAVAPVVLAEDPAADQPQDQMPAQPGLPADAFMQQLDKDGDGKVTLDEAKAPQMEQFGKIDADGNGALSAEEAGASFKEKVPPEMLEAMQERGMPDPGETFVKNLDTDGNGSVDLDEYEQPTRKSFAQMDQDGDGSATKEEATAYFDQLREKVKKQMEQMQQQMKEPPPTE